MRLIDADELTNEVIHDMAIVALHSNAKYFSIVNDIVVAFRETIDNAPTIDAVEVVRCKDCDSYVELAWWFDDEGKKKECHCCVAHSIPVQPNDYCSYGERREP